MDFSLTGILVRLVVGLLVGFCMGLTGVGGVLVLPSMTLLLGMSTTLSVGTASLYAFLTRGYAACHHFRLKTIDFRISLPILGGAVPADILVSWLINRYLDNVQGNKATLLAFQTGLKRFIAVVIIFSAVLLIINLVMKSKKAAGAAKSGFSGHLERHPVFRSIIAVLSGLLIGTLIGATSIGGGVLIIPILIGLFGLSPSRTVGSSIFIAVILTLITSTVYLFGAQVKWATALIMAGGSLAGVHWGSKLSVRMPEKILQCVMIGVVLVAGTLMIIGKSH